MCVDQAKEVEVPEGSALVLVLALALVVAASVTVLVMDSVKVLVQDHCRNLKCMLKDMGHSTQHIWRAQARLAWRGTRRMW